MDEQTSLEAYLQQLASAGERDSSGLFTLSAERVASRYRSLLQEQPALPWLRWVQLACQLAARRCRCLMLRDEYRLTLTACEFGEPIQAAMQSYPEPTPGSAGALHEVLWLFLAQEPQCLELTAARWQLRIYPDRFERSEAPANPEEDLVLRVVPSVSWLGQLGAAWRRGAIHKSVLERCAFFPGVLEWDGASAHLRPTELSGGARRRLLLAHLVARERAARVPHFAYHAPAAHRPVRLVVAGGNSWDIGGGDCDWLVLRVPATCQPPLRLEARAWQGLRIADEPELRLVGSEELVASGDRMRVRWLLMLSESELVGRFRPLRDGLALEPRDLPDWPAGSIFMAACPPDLKTDYSGLKLVEDQNLQDWLDHARMRLAAELRELTENHPLSAQHLTGWLSLLARLPSGPGGRQ